MQVTKLRASAGADGLVPAGRYFEHLAKTLRAANAREDAREARLAETLHRQSSTGVRASRA